MSYAKPHLDLVLVMSVEPGFGGQKFQPQALEKLRQLKKSPVCPTYLSIDGGINMETARLAVEAGANVLVAGTMIFHAPDPSAMIRRLKEMGQR